MSATSIPATAPLISAARIQAPRAALAHRSSSERARQTRATAHRARCSIRASYSSRLASRFSRTGHREAGPRACLLNPHHPPFQFFAVSATGAAPNMRFGIYAEMQTPPGKSHSAMTWEILRQIEHADQVGFDVYSVIDHHFFQKFSISANPLALFAAAAQHTERIRFRVALFTLPLENPMRLSGQIAEADILTKGRLECGLGRGHAWLFAPSAMPLEESRPRYEEAIEILERAWTTDRFSYDGKFYNVKDVTVVPKPVQKPYPPLYTGGTSDITYQMAGERGWGIFVPPLLPWGVLEKPLGIYKKACAEHGHK